MASTKLYLIAVLWLLPITWAEAQDIYCWNYTVNVKHFLNRRIKQSKDIVTIPVDNNLWCEMRLTNNGLQHTVKLDMKFTDSLGYILSANDILRINFGDGSRDEIMLNSKKFYEGTLSFILVEPQVRHSAVLTEDDQLFYDKLKKIDINSLSLVVDNVRRVIPINSDQAETIRRIVACFEE